MKLKDTDRGIFCPGTRVELTINAPNPERGTVIAAENGCEIVTVQWDGISEVMPIRASNLRVIVGEFSGRVLDQVRAIRDAGATNMFDIPSVQAIANREGYHDLVLWLVDHKREYLDLILHGPAK